MICRLRRLTVRRCMGLFFGAVYSPLICVLRERVLRSLESPLPLCIYRISYIFQKNNRQDKRKYGMCFVLIYEVFFSFLYLLTKALK